MGTCRQIDRLDMSLLFYVIVGRSHAFVNTFLVNHLSSANEIASYLILINIHKIWSHDRQINSEYPRKQITRVVESLIRGPKFIRMR